MTLEVDMRVRGIPAARHLLSRVPGGLVGLTAIGAIQDLYKEGISLMAANVRAMVLSEKTSGKLGESIEGEMEGDIIESGDEASGKVTMRIGSALPYAGFVAREIGWSNIGENVFIEPMGRWVFIDIRPPIPAHHFLEYTIFDLNETMPKFLGKHFTVESMKLQEEVDELQNEGGAAPSE